MNKNIVFLVWLILIGCLNLSKVSAQTYQTDGGVIVVEESLLNPDFKQIVFVATRNMEGPLRFLYKTVSTEGAVHNYEPLYFPQGIKVGKVVDLWNGKFNALQTTPWLRFDVELVNDRGLHNYTMAYVAINYPEQYKEPHIIEVSEVRINNTQWQITAKGVFDSYEISTIVLNNSEIIPLKAILQNGPSELKFIIDSGQTNLRSGKYLLTICQAGHCDTMVGRHRE